MKGIRNEKDDECKKQGNRKRAKAKEREEESKE